MEARISVRNLVEFILRSGDIEAGKGSSFDTEAMQAGSRIHRKIQSRQGSSYSAEVKLGRTDLVEIEEGSIELTVEGRADGIISGKKLVVIDEIKGMYADIWKMEKPIEVHRAQAMCYAYIYAKENKKKKMGVRLTYCNLETEDIRYFDEELTVAELEKWYRTLIETYAVWAIWEQNWMLQRNATLRELEFPFSYREGQKKLVRDVYLSIIREKKLYLEAPTGVGKTISTIFPSVKAMGEKKINKMFYLTAKTITRSVAENTFLLLSKKGVDLKTITITAKDKICIHEKADCNPVKCERAKGHFDRINDAIYDVLTHENRITRDVIEEYAAKHMVCPYEMSLDVANWADGVVCDYNYAFDPNVYLRRFFAGETRKDYAILIDEAHNLVERAREMYSARLYKEDFLKVRKLVEGYDRKLANRLAACNRDMLELKRKCEEMEVVGSIETLAMHLLHLYGGLQDFMQEFPELENGETVRDLFFAIRHFLNMYEYLDDKYVMYTDYSEQNDFRLTLQCMDPSANLERCLEKGKSSIFFSATFLPIGYYKEQLSGTKEDYAVYAPSPFSEEKRLLMVAGDVSTKYTRRTESEFQRIAGYIVDFVSARDGNYLIFFPSYKYISDILVYLEDADWANETQILVQQSDMSEGEREEFLQTFSENSEGTRVGLCIMGGIFGEGIDLKNDDLIGAVVVGTGLPMVCAERELFREYYDEKKKAGFEYAYLYQGMNKVLQSAGRVIRTTEDVGAILLLDERFLEKRYTDLFPREWFPYKRVNQNTMKKELAMFWGKYSEKS
ncbi:MAG: ATP-dependent DNA helicase [Lachnospiraceae bacterium]|nr:ATP-dependent DNA helicase [Lachnospiraceae bacterium]